MSLSTQLTLLIFFQALMVLGQEKDTGAVQESITVTATRIPTTSTDTPYSVDVVLPEDSEPGESMAETLRGVPGVVVSKRNNPSQGDRITIRGSGARTPFGVRGIKILLDGIPLTATDGQSQLNNIDLSNLARVEIIRGSSASLYGNSAGGVLNLSSDLSSGLKTSGVFGAHQSQNYSARYGASLNGFSFSVNGSHQTTQGFREHSAGETNRLQFAGSKIFLKDWSLNVALHHADSPYLLNPGSLDKATAREQPETARGFIQAQGAGKKVKQTQAAITLRRILPQQTFETTLFTVARDLENPIPAEIVDLERDFSGLRTVWSSDKNWFQVMVGLDLERQRDQRREYTNLGLPTEVNLAPSRIVNAVQRGPLLLDQQEQFEILAPFFQLRRRLTPELSLFLGSRYDYYRIQVRDDFLENGDQSGDRTMKQLSPMTGVSWNLNSSSSIYANLASSFQTPTANEMSNRQDGTGGFNPALNPEHRKTLEAGFRHRTPAYHGSLSVWTNRAEDMILPFQTSEGGQIYYRNAGEVHASGLEIQGFLTANHWLELDYAYSWSVHKFESYVVEDGSTSLNLKGNKVPGVPPQTLYIGGKINHNSGFQAACHIRWEDAYFANDENGGDDPQDAYVNDAHWLVDLRLGFEAKMRRNNFSVWLALDNVFNERYNSSIIPNAFGNRYFEPGVDRNLNLIIRYRR